jgi:hypothetical protein
LKQVEGKEERDRKRCVKMKERKRGKWRVKVS